TTFMGTREGGAFEAPSAIVAEIDDRGRVCRFYQYHLVPIAQAGGELAFEAPSAIVPEIDDRGRICRFDQYDLAQIDEARAQLDAVARRGNGGTGAAGEARPGTPDAARRGTRGGARGGAR